MGKYKKQVEPGIHTRIPLADDVLVIDVLDKVTEFKAERMLTKVMFRQLLIHTQV